jgi:hypothetical protein
MQIKHLSVCAADSSRHVPDPKRHAWHLAVAFAAVVAVAGCNRETRVPVFPVSGKVTFQGRPPVGALVVLAPVNGSGTDGVAPTATVQNDGSLSVTSYEPGDGAPDGDYVATLQWYRYSKELGGPGPNVIPAKYANARTSPFKVSVKGGPTDVPAIVLR